MMEDREANEWPEFPWAEYINWAVFFLVLYTLYNRWGSDMQSLGFNSYIHFLFSMAFAYSGNALTLFVVFRQEWSRYWKLALAATILIIVVCVIGLIPNIDSEIIRNNFGLGVIFVFFSWVFNVFTLIRVARLRKRILDPQSSD